MVIAKYIASVNNAVPTFNSGYAYTSSYIDNNDGTFTITLESESDFSSVSFRNEYKENLLSVEFLKITNLVTNLSDCFWQCFNVTKINTQDWDTSNVTEMSSTFNQCNSLTTIDVSNFDTSKVINMNYTFYNCKSMTTINIDNWNTSNVQRMSNMFYMIGDNVLMSLNVSSWDVSNVSSMDWMFYNCKKITTLNVSSWDVGKVTSMNNMFGNCNALITLDVSNWNMTNVNSSQAMFGGCNSLTTLDVSKWDVSNMTSMWGMFNQCNSLTTLDVSKWDVSNVREFSHDAYSYSGLFNGCNSLTSLNVENWNVSKATKIGAMFKNCSKLTNLNLSKWNIDNVIEYGNFITTNNLRINLKGVSNSTLNKWANIFKTTTNNQIDTINIYNSNKDLFTTKGWTVNNEYIIAKYKFTSTTDTLPVFNSGYEYTFSDIVNQDNTTDRIIIGTNGYPTSISFQNKTELLKIDLLAINSNISTLNNMFRDCSKLISINTFDWDLSHMTNAEYVFQNCTNLTNILLIENWNTSNLKKISGMFGNCSSLAELKISNWDTSKIISLYYTFDRCSKLINIDLSNWNIRGLTSMDCIFRGCSKLIKLNLNNWDTSNITSLYQCFQGCSSLVELNISNWDTSKVTNMESTFDGCSSLVELNISNWDTSKVTNMSVTFAKCSSLIKLDLNKWVISNVTTLSLLFNNCSNILFLNISNWDTKNVIYMNKMFENCYSLKTLNISNWDTKSVVNVSKMFFNCSNLKKIDLSKWNINNFTNISEIIDGCSELVSLNISNWNLNNVNIMSFISCNKLKRIIALNVNSTTLNKLRLIVPYQSPTCPNVIFTNQDIFTLPVKEGWIYSKTEYIEMKLNKPLKEHDIMSWNFEKEKYLVDKDSDLVNYFTVDDINIRGGTWHGACGLTHEGVSKFKIYENYFNKIEYANASNSVKFDYYYESDFIRIKLDSYDQIGINELNQYLVDNINNVEELTIPKANLSTHSENTYLNSQNIPLIPTTQLTTDLVKYKVLGLTKSTKYTIRLELFGGLENNIIVNLGGSIKIILDKEIDNYKLYQFELITPSELKDEYLTVLGSTNKIKKVMVYEGSIAQQHEYFDEIESVGELVIDSKNKVTVINHEATVGNMNYIINDSNITFGNTVSSDWYPSYDIINNIDTTKYITGINNNSDLENNFFADKVMMKCTGDFVFSSSFRRNHSSKSEANALSLAVIYDDIKVSMLTPNFWNKPVGILETQMSKKITVQNHINTIIVLTWYSERDFTKDSIFNIQIEEGTVSTPYEPNLRGWYKYDLTSSNQDKSSNETTTIYMKEPLRSIGNIRDRLYYDTNKGHYCVERYVGCDKHFNETFEYTGHDNKTNHKVLAYKPVNAKCSYNCDYVRCNKLKNNVVSFLSKDIPQIITDSYAYIFYIPKKELVSLDKIGVKQWLLDNGVFILYQYKYPTIEELPFQNMQKTPTTYSTKSIISSSNNVKPSLIKGYGLFEEVFIDPSTTYTLDFNVNKNNSNKGLQIKLGGKSTNITNANLLDNNRLTITTPSTLINNKLQFIGNELGINNVMLTKGENKKVDYFDKGFLSCYEQELLDDGKYLVKFKSCWRNIFDGKLEIGQYTIITGDKQENIGRFRSSNFIEVKSSTNYRFNVGNYNIDDFYILEYDANKKNIGYSTISGFHTYGARKYVRYITFYNKNSNDMSGNIQIEEGTTINEWTSYANLLEFKINEPLRGFNGVKDEIICKHDGFYVKRNIGSMVLKDGWGLSSDSSTLTMRFSLNVLNSNKNIICNNFMTTNTILLDSEGIFYNANFIFIKISRNKLLSQDVNGFEQWLQENPTIIMYQLVNPTYEKIDLITNGNLHINTFQNGVLSTETLVKPNLTVDKLNNGKTSVIQLPQPLQKINSSIFDRLYWDYDKNKYCIEKNINKYVYDENTSEINIQTLTKNFVISKVFQNKNPLPRSTVKPLIYNKNWTDYIENIVDYGSDNLYFLLKYDNYTNAGYELTHDSIKKFLKDMKFQGILFKEILSSSQLIELPISKMSSLLNQGSNYIYSSIYPTLINLSTEYIKYLSCKNLKPNSTYGVQFDILSNNNNPFKLNLGGTNKQLQIDQNTEYQHINTTIVTNDTIDDNYIKILGFDKKVKNVILSDKQINQTLEYLDGIQSFGKEVMIDNEKKYNITILTSGVEQSRAVFNSNNVILENTVEENKYIKNLEIYGNTVGEQYVGKLHVDEIGTPILDSNNSQQYEVNIKCRNGLDNLAVGYLEDIVTILIPCQLKENEKMYWNDYIEKYEILKSDNSIIGTNILEKIKLPTYNGNTYISHNSDNETKAIFKGVYLNQINESVTIYTNEPLMKIEEVEDILKWNKISRNYVIERNIHRVTPLERNNITYDSVRNKVIFNNITYKSPLKYISNIELVESEGKICFDSIKYNITTQEQALAFVSNVDMYIVINQKIETYNEANIPLRLYQRDNTYFEVNYDLVKPSKSIINIKDIR